MMYGAWAGRLAATAVVTCGLLACDAGSTTPAESTLADEIDAVRATYGVPSIAAVVVQDGEVIYSAGHGLADPDTGRAATADTLYGVASCSKPIVGLAAAILMEQQPDFDLDADINDWLEWPEPLAHPDVDTPITMRMLMTHRSGIVADGPDDYETYPKPDPDQPLDAFLQGLLGDDAYWMDAGPGEAEEYSNLGTALAGLVIEKAAGVPFDEFCTENIFEPLGLDDTRWLYGDLTAEQQARHAIPVDADGLAYEIYAFNDYPSGLLRTTADDFGAFLIAMSNPTADGPITPEVLARFHSVPMFIEPYEEGGVTGYEHAGGESGVTAFFTYREDASGYAYLINGELDDGPLDAMSAELDRILSSAAAR